MAKEKKKSKSMIGMIFKVPKIKKLPLKKRDMIIIAIIAAVAIIAFLVKGLVLAATVNGTPVWRFSVISELEKTQGNQVLNNLITESLVAQEAKNKGVTISEQDIEDQLQKIDDNLKSQGQSLDQALALQGLSKDDLKKQIRLQMTVEALLGDKLNVSDDEIQKFLTDNKSLFPEGTSEDDMKTQATSQLKQQKLSTEFQTLITDLEKNAQIKYFVGYGAPSSQ